MGERQSLVFQTESLKVAEEMTNAKAQVQILEEPCNDMVERNNDVADMTLLLHHTFNHQNDPRRSEIVLAGVKSK